MKHLVFYSAALLMAFLLACDANDFTEEEISDLSGIDPCLVGEFHNFALEKIILGVPDETAQSPEAGIRKLRELFIQSIDEYGGDLGLETAYYHEVSDSLLLYVASPAFVFASPDDLDNGLADLLRLGLITAQEQNLISQAYSNYGDSIFLQGLLNQWSALGLNTADGEGAISKAALCLAFSSSVFWSQSSFELYHSGEVVPRTPAHVDLGGFVCGAAVTALRKDGLNWSDVPDIIAGGVMTGAIASSGIAGRIGRWLWP